jgi:hypothetical protein
MAVLSMVCFRPYSEQSLREIFASHFDVVEIRQMREMPSGEGLFGKSFLWAVRMLKTS